MTNTWLGWLLVSCAVLWTLNCVYFISRIGQERKPISPKTACWDVLINAGIIAVVAIAAVRMLR